MCMFQETLKLQQDMRKKKQEMLEKQIEWQKVRETHTHAHRVNLCISLALLTALSTRNNRNTVVSLFIPPSFPAVFSPHSSLPFLPSSTFLTPPLSCYLPHPRSLTVSRSFPRCRPLVVAFCLGRQSPTNSPGGTEKREGKKKECSPLRLQFLSPCLSLTLSPSRPLSPGVSGMS